MSEIVLVGSESGKRHEVTLSRYPDGMPLVKQPVPYRDVDTMVLRPRSLEAFLAAMFLCEAVYERGGYINNLILPHVPGGRQDRINPEGDFLFTLSSVADLVNAQSFDKVVVVDPHSPATTKLVEDCKVFPLADLFHPEIGTGGYAAVIAPDAGAFRRACEVALKLGLPCIAASKKRDVATGKLSGFEVNVRPGHYLVVDDICDGGGTFLGLGQKIREQGATADLFVTHGLFTKGTADLLKAYRTICTTDSTLGDKPGVSVIPVVERMIAWTPSC